MSTSLDRSTTTSLNNLSAWDLIKKLAEAEEKYAYINETGEFVFESKDTTATSVYHFSGANDDDISYGKQILKIEAKQDFKNRCWVRGPLKGSNAGEMD